MITERYYLSFPAKVLAGFLSGYFSTLIFHQLIVSILWGTGLIAFKPYPIDATYPFGIPVDLSECRGGAWGILFMLIYNRIKLNLKQVVLNTFCQERYILTFR